MKKYRAELFSFLVLIGGILMDEFGGEWFRQPYVRFVWFFVAALPVTFPVLREAWKSICEKDFFNEFMLMGLAAIGAFYIGEYPEGVAVMLFYAVGERFQDHAVGRARDNIKALLDVRPDTASVIREGERLKVSPEEVEVGEIVEIRAGERVPLDGELLSEKGTFNTAALTGESVPRVFRREETVLAGMISTDRTVEMRVTRAYDQSALARILTLVQEASERKAPAELLIRRLARVYTPVVTGLALSIVLIPFFYSLMRPGFEYVFNDWLYRGLVFLVISCPCALVVSIPLGYFGGIGAASRLGVLFKGGNYLDAITKINTVVFDKTGTLTQGIFDVQAINNAGIVSDRELLRLIASVEEGSNHPIAKAIVKYARNCKVEFSPVKDVTEMAGYGLKASIAGKEILVGNARLLVKEGIAFPSAIRQIPETIVICAADKRYIGYLLLADAEKEDALIAVKGLEELKIHNIQILSGDKQAIVSKLAKRLGIGRAYGDLLPEGKVEHMEELKKDKENRIAFVGDGLNDAPVLALSDVGIAMGGLGSDAAIETADVVIQTDQPSKIVTAIQVGKQTHRVIWQNVTLAFSVKMIVLLLGAGGLATLWEAVFADVGVALLAILNAIRIQRLIK